MYVIRLIHVLKCLLLRGKRVWIMTELKIEVHVTYTLTMSGDRIERETTRTFADGTIS